MKWYNTLARNLGIAGHHAEVDLSAAFTVQCDVCEQVYDSYHCSLDESSVLQGSDICAWTERKKDGSLILHCGYGSNFDMGEFLFLKDEPPRPLMAVCDYCIRRMVADGVLESTGREYL